MRVVIERHAHAGTRGTTAPELVYLNIAAKLVSRRNVTAYLPDLGDLATSVGRDLLEAVDMIPGIDSARVERYRLIVTIAQAFDADAVLAEVLQAIERSTGESVEQ